MNPSYSHAVSGFCSYASAAEAIASTDGEEDSSGSEEIQELLEDLIRENNKVESHFKQTKKVVGGMRVGKYNLLRKRQIKLETKAWEEAANEYQELLVDMCEQKLAPNLPYIKSLFLGWFEPLRNAIAEDQEACRQPNRRVSQAPYFDHLPADKIAVITMHKLMGLLMTNNGGVGSVRVVQAAFAIGEAIENEARHMVIPYTPLLVPPFNWTRYDRGTYLFLPSYVMQTHGAKQQRQVIKRTPRTQLEPVFEVPLPEEPDTEDETEIEK